MGDFFEDLGKKISETAEAVSKKTEEVVEIQKLKNQVRGLERSNERDLMDLGKMVYDKFSEGEVIAPEFSEVCDEIQSREEEITACTKKIADLKGTALCDKCKYPLEQDMAFCPKCGHKVEREECDDCVDAEFTEEETKEETEEHTEES